MAIYKVKLADVGSFEIFTNYKAALTFARTCKDDHGGASIYRLDPTTEGGSHLDECLASWTCGVDGRVRKVNVG